jgi:hypothetical protein
VSNTGAAAAGAEIKNADADAIRVSRTGAGAAGAEIKNADADTIRVSNTKAATRIDLPPDSKPRSQILGESAQIPGRIVATIYLKMGLAKNWILEYWTPGSSAAGLQAPWPYTMFRPDPALPADTDALLVRAHLTVEGKLEGLALMAPTEWTRKTELFQALEQWRFRPAMRKGEAVAVELLLVVPQQPEQ